MCTTPRESNVTFGTSRAILSQADFRLQLDKCVFANTWRTLLICDVDYNSVKKKQKKTIIFSRIAKSFTRETFKVLLAILQQFFCSFFSADTLSTRGFCQNLYYIRATPRKSCLLLISKVATTYRGSTVTPFNRRILNTYIRNLLIVCIFVWANIRSISS